MSGVRRLGLGGAMVLIGLSFGPPVPAQSQAEKTGTSGATSVTDFSLGNLVSNPLVVGVVIAGAIGAAVALTADSDSPIFTTTVTTTR